MGEIVLMLHVANVACCNSHGWGANFFLMFYCPFRKKTL